MIYPIYTIEKFCSFSPVKQIHALYKLLKILDHHIANQDVTKKVAKEFLKLFPYAQEKDAVLTEIYNNLIQSSDQFDLLIALRPYYEMPRNTIKDDQYNILTDDGSNALQDIHTERFVIILDNLRSVFNVGSIFRTAECLNLEKLMLCGITPTPEHPNFSKTAMGTDNFQKWDYFSSTSEAIQHVQKDGFQVLGLETVQGAKSVFQSKFVFPVALVVGNEALGIDKRILQLCDSVCQLPVLGWKNSLNVAVATAIAAYHIRFNAHSSN